MAVVLVLSVSTAAMAGDIQGVGCANPGDIQGVGCSAQNPGQDIPKIPTADEADDLSTISIEIILDLLSAIF